MTNYNTSELAGYVRGGPARLTTSSPVDTADVREGVANNLNHVHDSSCQTLINISGRAGGKATWLGVASSTDFTRVSLLPPMPVVLRLNGDGSSSRVVLRMDARITIAGTATFRFALRPPRSFFTLPPPAASLGFSNVCELSTTSTSIAKLGPASLYITPDRDDSPYWFDVPTRDAAGSLGATRVVCAQLEVWAFSSSTGVPEVSALTAHEWIA